MSWIAHVSYDASKGRLRALYDRIKGNNNYLDNILTVHGLRPHSLEGHMALYKNVLHHSGNQLPKWQLETLGVYVSILNGCDYCRDHHFAGLCGLIDDDEKSQAILHALQTDAYGDVFDPLMVDMLQYAYILTKTPGEITESAVIALRENGLDDGQILSVNQVVSYFSYANRTVLGLGVSTRGDVLGLSPSDSKDADNWSHDHARC